MSKELQLKHLLAPKIYVIIENYGNNPNANQNFASENCFFFLFASKFLHGKIREVIEWSVTTISRTLLQEHYDYEYH